MLLAGPLTAVLIAYFVHSFLPLGVAILVGICAGLLALLLSITNKTEKLRVNNFEFKTEGDLGEYPVGHRGFTQYVSRADIRWLEYQDERGGGDVPYYPSGLYAELLHGSRCVLPYLDAQQTASLIQAIYKRFPDMPWDKKTPFDKQLTTLDLADPHH